MNKLGESLKVQVETNKVDFQEKEKIFNKEIDDLKLRYSDTCKTLMKVGGGIYMLQLNFALVMIFYFGCVFGSCENQLVCFVHYIKFFHAIYIKHTYYVCH